MDKKEILRRMVEQAQQQPAPPVTLYLFALPLGGGNYRVVTGLEPRSLSDPPAYFSFMTDNADEVIVWSINPFLSRDHAHEIAIQFGAERGLYV